MAAQCEACAETQRRMAGIFGETRCPEHQRIALRLSNLETVARAAKVLVIGDEENMQYGYLRAALERLDQ